MSRSESLINIAVRAVTIAALGGMIGLVDSMRRGPVRTKLDTPASLGTPSGAGVSGAPTSTHTSTPATTPGATPGAPGDAAPSPPTSTSTLPDGHITVARARELFDQQAHFIDSRKREEYEAGHVQGAIRMELADFKDAIPPPIEFMVKGTPVVVYCVGGDCDESEAVGKQLNILGFTSVVVMHDGFPGWKQAGHPVETGPGQWP